MNTILFSGLGLLILAGISFLIFKKIENSGLAERNKTILNYVVISMLILVTILVFNWHSSAYFISI